MADVVKKQAEEFAKKWEGRGYEKGESQSFWNGLLRDILGVEKPEDFIEYEDQVLMDKSTGFIDGYIPSAKILIEQKSIDKDLKKPVRQSDGSLLTPFEQAKRYIVDLPVDRHPRWVITCNFREFHIYDMNKPGGEPEIILLKDLPKEYYRLSFITDTENVHLKKEMELSLKAGDRVGELYDAFSKQYHNLETDEREQKSLNQLIVRIVFCLYAEDAGLFKHKNQFHDYLARFNPENIRTELINLFRILDQKEEERDPYLSKELLDFPYVNGGIFSDDFIIIPQITEDIKELLLAKASDDFDWSEISPTIFGAVFESTLNPETRRSGGMHYTSIENIHKVIDPLFLDDLKKEMEEIKSLKQRAVIEKRAREFQDKLSSLKWLDPAAGSGNFLTESYICIRRLENEALRLIFGEQMSLIDPVKVSIGQFYGIEINDFAVAVARTALWIAESQMKKATEDMFNINLEYLPLKSFPNIREANALRIDWNEVVPAGEVDFIMGNPPFVGKKEQSKNQKEELVSCFGKEVKGVGNLDYVSGWYQKASEFIKHTGTHVAFVSTNSITQGEQVPILWRCLLNKGIRIDFAYKTFRWDSEANIKAHVHCVIIGFSYTGGKQKVIYEDERKKEVTNINPYLVDAANIIVESRSTPLCDVPEMSYGSMPIDDKHLILKPEHLEEYKKDSNYNPDIVRQYIGGDELINNKKRYCFWLKDVDPNEYIHSKFVMNRIEETRQFRLSSKRPQTLAAAETPHLFGEIRQPDTEMLVVPKVSSENRSYIPIGFVKPEIIVNGSALIIPDANLYLFGILMSNVHNAWMRVVCGRMKSDYQYSVGNVYNTFPFPEATREQKERIEKTARAILEARSLYPNNSLDNFYGQHMYLYPEILKAHQENDKAVMAAYGIKPGDEAYTSESACVALLMEMYQKLTEII